MLTGTKCGMTLGFLTDWHRPALSEFLLTTSILQFSSCGLAIHYTFGSRLSLLVCLTWFEIPGWVLKTVIKRRMYMYMYVKLMFTGDMCAVSDRITKMLFLFALHYPRADSSIFGYCLHFLVGIVFISSSYTTDHFVTFSDFNSTLLLVHRRSSFCITWQL